MPQWRDVELLVNWTVIAAATPAWAQLVHPGRSEGDALTALWRDLAFVYRLDQADAGAAWRRRVDELTRLAESLTARRLERVRLVGPGTDLEVGLLPGALWAAPTMVSAGGVPHLPNLPTEEVFTVPDPERVDGVVRLTRPAVVGGRRIDGVTLHFRAGRVAGVDGPPAADALRAHLRRDDGAARLGELALVDASSRVGRLNRTFGVILLDEKHLDVMVGSPDVTVTAIDTSGTLHTLLDRGTWAGGLAG